ncbi:LOW QUALITY PROTEIN: hypothetical protein V1477_017753 [Vespula maculifrons]|uniref:Uncharacterized protein n=1 Tax=Vespula maculifrons TaxID=7453 RepID=A0ABD2B0D7_VESMC
MRACRARRALSNDPGPVFLGAIVSEKKIKKFFLPLFPLNRYNSAPIGHILIKKIWACRPRRALSNDPGPVFLGAIVSEKKIVKEKILSSFVPLKTVITRLLLILIKKIWACRARRALSNDPGPVFLGAIVSEKKIVKEKILSSFVPLKTVITRLLLILIKKIWACRARRALFNDPGPVFLGAIVSEKKIKKFFLPLFPLNRYNSAPIGQILIKKIWACRPRRALSNDPGPVFLGAIVSEKKIKKFFLPLFPLNRYNSAPIGQIFIKKIWACMARRALSNDPGPVFLGTTVSEKKIKKFCLPLFPLNRYNSAPVGQILIKKIWACRARRALSKDPGPVFLGAIVSEKKIKKFFLPLFHLNRYNSAPIGQILIKKTWACRPRRALSNDPGPVFLGAIVSEKKIKKFCLPLFPLNRYNSAPIGQILIKIIWACRAQRALSNDPSPVFLGAIVSEKKIKKFCLPLFPLNRYNSAPIGQILIKKMRACRARRALSNDPGPVFLGAIVSEKKIKKFCLPLFPLNRYNSAPIGQILIKIIWACRAQRALSNDPSPVFLGAIVSEKKIKKFFLPLFPLNRYNSAPIGHILIKKIWACRPRRALSNDPGPVFLGAIVSEKKIVKEKILSSFVPLKTVITRLLLILIKKIWACRARRALSNDPGPVFLGAIVSEKKIVKEKILSSFVPLKTVITRLLLILIKKIWACRARRALSNDPGPVFLGAIVSEEKIKKFCLPLFPLNRYNSARIGQILIKKIWACRARRALSSDPGPVFLRATVSEKKIKKFCLPLFPLNRYNSAPIGQILIKKIRACRARRALSNVPGPVFVGAIVSEKKIVKEKILSSFVPLKTIITRLLLILIKKIWACRARRTLSNDPGPVFLGAIVSEKKIKKFFLPLFPLNRYNSARIGQILIKKIWACRARRALSNVPGPVFLGAIVSEKKIKKFCLPLFPLNRYNSAPVGQILIKKIWACRARRALSKDPAPVFLGAIVSEKKIKKFFLPLFHLNRYNSAPIGQILIKKTWACRPRRALSNDPGPVFLGAIVSEKKIVKKKFFLPLFPLNRYNSAPIGQIFIKKIWACMARRALSNDPGPVFLGAIVSEKKIKKFCLPLFPLNRYNSAPIGQILIKKIRACRARRALSNDPGPVFLGAIVSEKKIKKFCLPLFPLNRYNSARIGQILIKKIWACRARRALSNDPGPVFLRATVSEKKIKKFCLPLFPLNRYNSAPIGQILIKKIRACRARRALSNVPGTVFLGAIVSEKKIVKEKILSSFVPLKTVITRLLLILIKKIWACRARRALSNDPGPVFLGAIVSEKKIKKFFLPLFPLNRYNSAPIGQMLIKKIWACRPRRALSNDPGPVFLGAIVSEKKIKKFCLPLFPLNRYNSAPIGQILIKKIWACRARRALSNDPGPVFLGAIVSEKKIKKFCLPLFPFNRNNSAPIGQILIKKIWACRARRALSNDPGQVFLGAIVSEKKIKKFCLPLFPLNRYNSAPIGQIFIKKIWACMARRALSNDPGPVFLGTTVSEKKIKKFCLPLFPLNRYNSAPVGQILTKKIWACRARRALSKDPGPVFLGAIVSEKKIKKFFLPLFPLNRYNSAPIGQILIKKMRACRARRALSNDPGPFRRKKLLNKKFCLPLFPLNRYNSAPIGQILIKKIWACRARRALSNDPGPVFLRATVSEKKIKKFCLPLFPLNRYNSAPIGQILIKKIRACRARRALSNVPGPVFLGAIVSEKKIVKEKILSSFVPLKTVITRLLLILIKKIWACRARRALSNDPGPVFLGAIVSEKKIVKEKILSSFVPLKTVITRLLLVRS